MTSGTKGAGTEGSGEKITAALIGNPNVGKTEIFNRLTGLSQRVGNFPGVTVEKKAGRFVHKGQTVEVVDLPGTYSLSAKALDELVARDFIVEEKPDVVVDIVDGTCLERNLYLTFLLLEIDANLVIALNRWDMVKSRALDIDLDRLSGLLGVPIVTTVATTGEGLEALKDAVISAAKSKKKPKLALDYGDDVEASIRLIESVICEMPNLSKKYPRRWLAIKLIERDERILEMTKACLSEPQMAKIQEVICRE
jgi:ferrous iron transport protein B